MKQSILILLFACISSLIGQTNIYHSFPSNTAIWNFNASAICLTSGSTVENYSIIFDGDTTINNSIYIKLAIPYVDRSSFGMCSVKNNGYQGAIREDASTKKVYHIKPQQTTEQLLYDFTLQVGDSITGILDIGMGDTVISIDSVLVGNNYRKRWTINTCYNISIIEGIGSTYGLLEGSPGCITDMPDYSLTCFQGDSTAIFPTSSSSCETITSITNNNLNRSPITVFPNPTKGEINIDFNDRKIKEARLFNLLGELIETRNATNSNRITINNLPIGTLVIELIDESNESSHQKIIVTE